MLSRLFLNNKNQLKPIWIIISAFLVLGIRFNRWILCLENLIGSKVADDKFYVDLVNHFKSGTPETIRAPFAYRLFVPFLASKIPTDAFTAINLLNAFAFIASIFFLRKSLINTTPNTKIQNTLILLFIFSFPSAYYSVIGYLDVWLVFLASFTVLVVTAKFHWLWFIPIISIGVFIKESVIVLLPLMSLYSFSSKNKYKTSILFFITALSIWLGLTFLIRNIAPAANDHYLWLPSIDKINMNLDRARLIPSLALTIGVQGFWMLWLILTRKIPLFNIWTLGFASWLILWLFAFTSAYADGRFIWPGMVFSTMSIAQHYSFKSTVS